MPADISKPEGRRQLQGDVVLARSGKEECLLTIVRVGAGSKDDHLELKDRAARPPESWPLDQATVNEMKSIKHEKAQWEITL